TGETKICSRTRKKARFMGVLESFSNIFVTDSGRTLQPGQKRRNARRANSEEVGVLTVRRIDEKRAATPRIAFFNRLVFIGIQMQLIFFAGVRP
ncbi:MAG: hypothetical protein ACLFOY_19470, partial [Desulfatibacillaceae bacterium]